MSALRDERVTGFLRRAAPPRVCTLKGSVHFIAVTSLRRSVGATSADSQFRVRMHSFGTCEARSNPACRLPARSLLDGEAVIFGGISDFNALHSGKHNEEVQLCAFDVLAMDGEDLRRLPLSMRKANLARLLARRPEGIFHKPLRAGRDRAGPVSQGVRVWAGRYGKRERRKQRPERL